MKSIPISLVLVIWLLFGINFNGISQSFSIGQTTITFVDNARNRNIETEIYYPSNLAGLNQPIAAGAFPVLVFGHGFVMSWSAYQVFWEELVPKGYVLCFPKTETGISPNHAEFGKDLAFVANQMQTENNQSNSFFYQTLSSKTALLGHSMGGGASFLAAENNLSVDALVNFAAAETNPSAVAAAGNVTIPSLLFSGDDDCVTPPANHQNLLYASLASSCKTQITIINGGHCYFANSNFNCTFGESSCNSSLNITRAEQQQTTFDFLTPWLNYYLKNDNNAYTTFNDSLQASSRVNYQQSCNTTSLSNKALIETNLVVYPNPVSNQLHVNIHENQLNGMLFVTNTTGKIVEERQMISPTVSIDVSDLTKGIYFIRYSTGDQTLVQKFIKE